MIVKAAEIKQLSIAFETQANYVVAVNAIDFELRPGETLGLLGESGCGKSLTSLALMRLLPPGSVYGMSSEVWVDNQDVLLLPEYLMRSFRGRRLAMIFQEPMTALNPVLSIGEQLAEALRQHQNLGAKKRRERILELLEEVEMPHPEQCLLRYPHQLSGGQRQRVMIAMALANRPDILIADEPTTALDVTIQAQILALIKKLQTQYNMGLLLITHDLGVIKSVADRVCVMYAGEVVELADVHDFFNQPRHPYVQKLLESLPSMSQRGRRLQGIEGSVPALDAMPSGCRFHPRCVHQFERCFTEVPQIQRVTSDRWVRCHLYPQHDVLPPLPAVERVWDKHRVSEDTILSVERLSVHFPSSPRRWFKHRVWHHAVDGVSFALLKGQTLALVGESGCGKTTLARTLLLLQQPTSGRILFDNQDITKLRGQGLKQFRQKVQIIFQDPFSSMNPRLTVGDIIAEGMRAQKIPTSTIQRKQYQLLEQVHLPRGSLEKYPHEFSGGQRQRIGIARALAVEPEILICDEPTSALDISVQAKILNLLKELQQEHGLSYLFISHNMGVVSYMADEVLVMQSGRIVERGRCVDVLTAPTQEYTRHLLESVLGV